jgi:hypothetical protein
MKKTKLKIAHGIVLVLLVMSSSVYAVDEIDPQPQAPADEIDPPPPAPLDDYLLPAAIFGLLLGVSLVLKSNLKTETK